MKVIVNGSGLRRTENISPPLRNAVTIPIYVDGQELVVYVALGVFQPPLANEGNFVKLVAALVAQAIEGLDGEARS